LLLLDVLLTSNCLNHLQLFIQSSKSWICCNVTLLISLRHFHTQLEAENSSLKTWQSLSNWINSRSSKETKCSLLSAHNHHVPASCASWILFFVSFL
jgi:hypothetical protein